MCGWLLRRGEMQEVAVGWCLCHGDKGNQAKGGGGLAEEEQRETRGKELMVCALSGHRTWQKLGGE